MNVPHRLLRASLPVVVALALAACAAHSRPAARSAAALRVPTSPEFTKIASMEGTWVRVGDDGGPTDEVVSVYRSTAAGTAVAETLFPGQPHQMETIYRAREGGGVELTHHCVEGNCPHLVSIAGAADRLVFECAPGSPLDAANERHMHRGELVFLGPDRVRTRWSRRAENGKIDYVAEFELVRADRR